MVKYLKSDIKEFKNVFHIADIHLRLTKRHDEYNQVFERLYKAVERTPAETVVAVLGDVLHSKSDLSPECVKITTEFLQNLADRRPTVLIAGNHDATLANKNRLDSLSPIVDAINHTNLFYLKDSGLYILGDILFNHYSVFDEPDKYIKFKDIPKIYLNETRYKIALFHGPVNNAITDVGYKVASRTITNEIFDGHDIVLLGDIHRHQVLSQSDPIIVYVGSLIQQNHGEELKGHGFVFWDLKTKVFKHFEIPNDYGFYTAEISKGKLLTDISDMPKKARLRLKCFESVATEVKSVLSTIREKSDVTEVAYVRVDSPNSSSSNIIDNTNFNLSDVSDVDYQNKLITEYLNNKNFNPSKDTLDKIYKINKDLNATLEKESVVRNIRWKPKKFEFDNMFSYGEENVIDFTKMHNVVGLFANNASGKSSILSALSFCIFDKCDRAFKASHILNTQKMSFRCKFNFEVNGVDFFIERKGNADKKGNVKVDVKFWKEEGGKVVELNGEARRSTNDIIRDYVGTYDDFILTVLSIQNNKVGSFVDMGQTERKDLLAQFMGLTVFDSLYNDASDKTKEINSLLKNFKNTDYTQKLLNLNSDIENFSGSLRNENVNLEKLTDKRESENERLLEETKKIINVNGNIVDIVSLESKKVSLSNSISTQSSSLDSYKNQLSSIESTFKEYDEIIKNYDIEDITTKYDSLKELESSLSQKEQGIEKKKIVVTSKLQKLKKLEEHKYDPNCTFCTTNVFVKDAIKTREELESDKVEAQNLVGEYTNLKNKVNELSYIKDDWKKYNDTHKLHVETQSKINKLNNEILKISNKISSDQNSLINIENQIEEYYNNKDAIEFNKTIKETIDVIKSNIKTIDFEIKNVNNNIISYNTKISGLEEQRKTIQKSIEDVKVLEVEYEAYQLYTNAISRDGIPYELISQALPTIEKEVNNILNQIVEFTVILQTDGKNVTTHINYEDKRWPLELASGMERFVSSLAMRVALINISNLPRPNFIAIDEGFGCADADNLSSMGALFAFLKTNFDFVWIISHLDSMRDMVDNRLEIKKENGFSKVNYV
jgi:DNA repair exonuclease SbcCD ATPase subunit/DNA repair exonuclease SbcCD nuclease subunit